MGVRIAEDLRVKCRLPMLGNGGLPALEHAVHALLDCVVGRVEVEGRVAGRLIEADRCAAIVVVALGR